MLYLLLPALLALAPAIAGATPPRPDDPGAAVPETRYSPPPAYRPAEKQATTPDRHWIEANRSVLGYNPMMLTMPERAPASTPAAAPARTDKPAPAPAPAHDHAAHAAHGGHDGKGHH